MTFYNNTEDEMVPDTSRGVRRLGSHIYFFDEINPQTQFLLQGMISEATKEIIAEHATEIALGRLSEIITIHLNCGGGWASCGFALYDIIKSSQVPVQCIVEGLCASAATLIFLACENRVMTPNSTFLMHQCSWGAVGQNKYIQDQALNAEKTMRRLRKIYMEETDIGISIKDPAQREEYIQKEILEHDIEYSTDECKELGVIRQCEEDEDILDEEDEKKVEKFIEDLVKSKKKVNSKNTDKKKVDKKSKSKNKKSSKNN